MQRAEKGVTGAIRKQMQPLQSAPGKHGRDAKCRESAGKKGVTDAIRKQIQQNAGKHAQRKSTIFRPSGYFSLRSESVV